MSARPNPFELVFAEARFGDEVFPAIANEAESRGIDPLDPDRFPLLAQVGTLLRELVGPEEPGTAVREVAAFIYHAFHYWCAGRHVRAVDDETARAATVPVASAPPGDLAPAAGAGYVQLPRNLFWARVADDAAAEPADGFFWVAAGDGAVRTLSVLLILGLRTDRPGFSLLHAAADTAAGVAWLHEPARPPAADFANVLPGGELQRLHSIVTAAELLKLAHRLLQTVADG